MNEICIFAHTNPILLRIEQLLPHVRELSLVFTKRIFMSPRY
jgi:hypothetical protein